MVWVFFPNPTDTFIKPSDLCACNSQATTQERLHRINKCTASCKLKPSRNNAEATKHPTRAQGAECLTPPAILQQPVPVLEQQRNSQENRKLTLIEGGKGARSSRGGDQSSVKTRHTEEVQSNSFALHRHTKAEVKIRCHSLDGCGWMD